MGVKLGLPIPLGLLAMVILFASGLPCPAGNIVTLTDRLGREMKGELAGVRNQIVHVRLANRRIVDVPWERLSDESRKLVEDALDEGRAPGGLWPQKGGVPVPYRFDADSNIWTGTHVRLVFPAPPKSSARSSPEAAFLRALDIAVAAVKAMPLGDAVDTKEIFECEVLPDNAYGIVSQRIKERIQEKRRLAQPPAPTGPNAGFRGEYIIVGPSLSSLPHFPRCIVDMEQRKLYVRQDAPQNFLQPDPKRLESVPFFMRDRIVRQAAAELVFGDSLELISPDLQQALFDYVATIDQVTNPELDYTRIGRGLQKMVREGLPRLERGALVTKQPSPESAATALRVSGVPATADAVLYAYYLLHMDKGGDAGGLAAYLRMAAKHKKETDGVIRDYNQAVTEWARTVMKFNKAVADFNSRVADYNTALASGNPQAGVLQPGNPPERPEELPILKLYPDAAAVSAFVKKSKEQAESMLRRGRTSEEFAADFRAKMESVVK